MIIAISITGTIALLIGFGLVQASQRLSEKPDEKFERVINVLPGANCGGCGFAGCKEYAKNVIRNPNLIGKCSQGGKTTAKKLSIILNHKGSVKKRFAVIMCKGGTYCKDKGIYQGIKTCAGANLVADGPKECSFGCMGFGDCVKACRYDAIRIGTKGYPVVDIKKCVACGMCVKACPKDIIKIKEKKEKIRVVVVDCRSLDEGKKVSQSCKNGCIACGTCERVCPKGAIKVIDNLAVIDYDKCIGCGICVKNCPMDTISFID